MEQHKEKLPAYQQRRAAQADKARELKSDRILLAGLVVSIITLVLGVMTFVPWLFEGEARKEEREVRKATLIESAYKTIADLKPAKGERLLVSARLNAAMATLVRYGEPVQLEADIIDLTDVELACGDYILKAPVVRLRRAEIVRARLAVEANLADLDVDARESFLVLPYGSERHTRATYLSGALNQTVVHSPGPAIVDVYGERSAISAGPENFFHIEQGTTGKLTLVKEELNDRLWPLRSYADRRDAEALPGENRKTPPLEVFERPASSDINSNRGLAFGESFLARCPQGVCSNTAELPAIVTIFRSPRYQDNNCSVPEIERSWWEPMPDFDSVSEEYVGAVRDFRRATVELGEISNRLEALGDTDGNSGKSSQGE